jgi:hypothetical protein
MVVAAQGPPVVLPAALDVDAADNSTIRVAAITADAPVVFAITPFLPDYAIAEVQPWTDFPIPGQSFSVSVQLLNQGGAPESGADTPELVAAWDNPPGTGMQSGTLLVPDLEHNAELSVTLPVDLPADLTQPHLLYVGINPAQRIAESNYANNSQRVTVGGLPTPKMLEGAAQAGQTLVTLSWDAVSDPRVVGYHVYRRIMVGAGYQPVGSTFTTGFADLTPWLENNYEYVVSAYDDFGHESALSAPLLVQLPAGPPTYRIELPFFINEP